MHEPRPSLWARPAVWLPALLIASVLLRLHGLTESIWYDEFWRTHLKLNPEQIGRVLLRDVHNPLYNTFMYGWINVFGDAELSIRIPSMLAGYGSALLLWRWARARLTPLIADLTLAWLLLSPVHAWYSTEAKNNMFSVFFATLILVTHDRLLRPEPRRRDIAAATLAATLGVYTDFAVLMALIPIWAAIAWATERGPDRRPALLRLTAVILATTALAAPLLAFKAMHTADFVRDYLVHFNIRRFIMLLFNWLPTGNAIIPRPRGTGWAIVAIVTPVALPCLVMGTRWLLRRPQGTLVAAAALAPPFFYLAASGFVGWYYTEEPWFYQERNLLVMLPVYGLVLMAGAARLGPARRALVAVFLLSLNLLGSVLAVTTHAAATTVMHPNPDWRAAAAWLDAHADDDGAPVILFAKTAINPLLYYTRRPRIHWISAQENPPEVIRRTMSKSAAPHFYILNSEMWWRLLPEDLATIEAEFPVLERHSVLDLDLLKLSNPNPVRIPRPTPPASAPPPRS